MRVGAATEREQFTDVGAAATIEGIAHHLSGYVSIENLDTGEILYENKNVIVNGVSYLFAREFLNPQEPFSGVWGLAIGQGGIGWSDTLPPPPVANTTSLVAEIKRKQLKSANFVDQNGNPTATMTTSVKFTTVLNASLDGITIPIREMGLIGGGTTLVANSGPTDMLTAAYFNPVVPVANTVLLINYFTLPALNLPLNTNYGIAWQLNF